MFERFTARTRRALVAAGEEAGRFGERVIEPEHVLLGVLVDEEAVATRVLRRFGVDHRSVREQISRRRADDLAAIGVDLEAITAAVEDAFGAGALERAGGGRTRGRAKVAFGPASKKVLELALREALALKHGYIGTEHVVLAISTLGTGVAPDVLRRATGGHEQLRAAILAEVASRRAAASG